MQALTAVWAQGQQEKCKRITVKKHITYTVVAIASLVGAALVAYSMQSSPETPAPLPIAQKNHAEPPLSIGKSADYLVAHSKIDPSVVIPSNGRAYSISRTQSLPEGDPRAYVQSLLARSEAGDARATYDIYIAVSQCKSTLEAPSLSLLQAYRAQGAEQQYKESLAQNLEKCEGLVSDPQLSDTPWLKRAADQGSIEAKIMYSIDTESVIGERSEYLSQPERLIEYRADAMNNLKSAASTGSVDALMALGRAYETGILTDKSPTQSLAYYQAAYSAAPNPYLQDMLARDSKKLSYREVESAKILSEKIIEGCCR